jgi:hypothetical protein
MNVSGTPDELFSDLAERIPKANANRKFAFFVQEILVYDSYLRREKTVGDLILQCNCTEDGAKIG